MSFEPIQPDDERIAHQIIGSAIEVHRILGPGFIESIYQKALEYELLSAGLSVECERPILVPYKDIRISGHKVDLLVGGRVIVELKAIEAIAPIHQAKLLSYLKATSLRLGLIINVHSLVLKDGIKRMVR